MRRIQKFVALGASMLLICFMAIAGVLAAGSLSTTVTVNIHHDGTVQGMVWVATCGNNAGGTYYQSGVTAETFNTTTNSARIYDAVGAGVGEQTSAINAFTTNAASFKFDDAGQLIFYFLIANYDETATLTYTIAFTYGASEQETSTLIKIDSENTSPMADVLVNEAVNGSTPTKSLCTIVLNVKEFDVEFTGANGEKINIDVTLSKAVPVEE